MSTPAQTLPDALLGAFLALMPDAAVTVDLRGRIVAANEQAEHLFRYDAGALVGLDVETLVPDRLRHRHRQHRAGYLRAPQPRSMGADLDLTGRRADGHEFPVTISLAPLTSNGGELVVAAVRDVTERRVAALAQAELAAIVRSSLDAIVSTTIEGHVTNSNPAVQVLFGYSPEEVRDKHLTELFVGEESEVLEQLLDEAYRGDAHGARDTRWKHRDGTEIDVAVSASPLRDPAGEVLGFSLIVRDISERKRAELELRQAFGQARRLQQQHEAKSQIRLALLNQAPLEMVLSLICSQVSDMVGARVGFVSMTSEDGLRVSATNPAASSLTGTTLPSGSFEPRVMRLGHAVVLSRRSENGDEFPSVLPDGPALAVLIPSEDRPIGVLTVIKSEGAVAFDEADVSCTEALAAQAALALEFDRGRRDSERLALVGDRERIARDLHDLVIQELFSTGLNLSATLATVRNDLAQQKITEVLNQIDGIIRTIRNTVFNITARPTIASQHRTAILDVVERARPTLGFEPHVTFDGHLEGGVPDEVFHDVVAVVNESLSNIGRHAGASSATVEISVGARVLTVVVEDDGTGIGSPARSSGLANLAERAHLLGGTFDASARPGGGTRVRWSIPVPLVTGD